MLKASSKLLYLKKKPATAMPREAGKRSVAIERQAGQAGTAILSRVANPPPRELVVLLLTLQTLLLKLKIWNDRNIPNNIAKIITRIKFSGEITANHTSKLLTPPVA